MAFLVEPNFLMKIHTDYPHPPGLRVKAPVLSMQILSTAVIMCVIYLSFTTQTIPKRDGIVFLFTSVPPVVSQPKHFHSYLFNDSINENNKIGLELVKMFILFIQHILECLVQ